MPLTLDDVRAQVRAKLETALGRAVPAVWDSFIEAMAQREWQCVELIRQISAQAAEVLRATAIDTATHEQLDAFARVFGPMRRGSPTQTEECPVWCPIEGCWIESDAQFRARCIPDDDPSADAFGEGVTTGRGG